MAWSTHAIPFNHLPSDKEPTYQKDKLSHASESIVWREDLLWTNLFAQGKLPNQPRPPNER